MIALLAIILAVAGFLRWRNDLHLFRHAGNEIGADDLAAGRTLYVGEGVGPSPDGRLTVHIKSIRPVVTANTAHATIRVLMCTLASGVDAGLGSGYSLRHVCASFVPFAQASYTLGNGVDAGTVAVIVAVTPHSKGHVHIAGVEIDYERGLQRASQRTGIEIDTRTHMT